MTNTPMTPQQFSEKAAYYVATRLNFDGVRAATVTPQLLQVGALKWTGGDSFTLDSAHPATARLVPELADYHALQARGDAVGMRNVLAAACADLDYRDPFGDPAVIGDFDFCSGASQAEIDAACDALAQSFGTPPTTEKQAALGRVAATFAPDAARENRTKAAIEAQFTAAYADRAAALDQTLRGVR